MQVRRSLILIPAGILVVLLPEARYALAAYLPGLVLLRALRPGAVGLVDLVLLPSLLSVLPFCWLVMAGLALGLGPAAAGWAAILPFLVAGLVLRTWPAPSRKREEVSAVAVACGLSCLLLAVPFAANAFAANAWDGPLHAAVATRVLAGVFPPDSAIVAGQPLGYYWLYHLYAAVLSELTALSLYQVFALVSVHAFVLLSLAGYRLCSRLASSQQARLAGIGLLVFGLNPFGWLLFLRNAARHPDPWQSLLVPLEMVSGYPGQLGSLIHQFLDGNPFAISFPFWVVWLDRAVAWIEGERDAAGFVTGALALASALYLHLFSGAFLVAASAAAAAIVASRGVLAMLGCASLATLPYAWDVLGDKARNPVHLDFRPAFVEAQALAIAASLGLLLILAAPAFRSARRGPASGPWFLSLYCLVLAAAALVTRTPANTQYKLLYLILPALAALAASTGPARRAGLVLAIAIGIPTNALTSYAFAANPPREALTPEKQRLYAWVRSATPPDSVFVEDPGRADDELPLTQRLYADREWFEIPIYGRRRMLVGYTADVLAGEWGYRDVPRRQRLAQDLTQGRPLRPWGRELLGELLAPIYVVVRAQPSADAFASDTYRLVRERDRTRVYQVTP